MNKLKSVPVVMLVICMLLTVFFAVSCGGGDLKITQRHKNGLKKTVEKRDKDGNLQRMYWNRLGLQIRTHVYQGKKLVQKTSFQKGRKWKEEFFQANNKKTIKWYYPGAGISDLRQYKDGKPHGRWAYWDKRGKLVSDIQYENGKEINTEAAGEK